MAGVVPVSETASNAREANIRRMLRFFKYPPRLAVE
jgi:hypothetical protein